MYLHEDRGAFKDIIEQVADEIGRTPIVVEKDYYVTLILKQLSEKLDNCVFKGGTSLSKGFHAIDRFQKILILLLMSILEKVEEKSSKMLC